MADNFAMYDCDDFFTPNYANNVDIFCDPSPILVPNYSTTFPPVELGDQCESVDVAMSKYYPYVAGDPNSSCTNSRELPSCSYNQQQPSLIQRSMSGHLLQNHEFHHPAVFSYLNESPQEILSRDNTEPMMRKAVSTGDMQRIDSMRNGCHSRSSSSLQERLIIEETMRPVVRYNAEERKERIEKYKSKKNQRNFNKKIQYVCRKTLADNRPRTKGRFMRNEETNDEIISSTNHSQSHREEQENEQDDHNDIWTSFLDELLAIN